MHPCQLQGQEGEVAQQEVREDAVEGEVHKEEGGEEVQNDVRQVLIMRWLCRNHSTSAQAGRLDSSLAPVRFPIVPYYPFVLREGCSSILRRCDARLQVPATALRASRANA